MGGLRGGQSEADQTENSREGLVAMREFARVLPRPDAAEAIEF